MDAKLIGIISASDAEAIAFVQMELYEQDYFVVSDDVNFVFGIPTTELVTPVCLMAHIDTCRKSDDVIPAVFFDTLYNQNGEECKCLGADDRAGVYIALAIASKLENKPYILFTTGEETGHTGVTRFLQAEHPERVTHEESFWKGKKLIEPYLDDLYCILQYDRSGFNDVVCYGNSQKENELIDKAEVLGYKYAYGSTSDSRNLSDETGVAHLNLSAGFLHQHTPQELLLLPTLDFAIRNGVILAQMIDRPFRVDKPIPYVYTPRKKEYTYPPSPFTKPIDVMHPTCDICEKHRPVKYLAHAAANVCHKCIRRAGGEDKIDYLSITEHQMDLEKKRKQSKLGNIPFTPNCPYCGEDTEVYPLQDGVCFCDGCASWFLKTDLGAYIWAQADAKSATFKFLDKDKGWVKVEVTDPACPLDYCDICQELMHDRSLSYYDNLETGEYTFVVCDKCNAIDPVSRRR